MCLSIIAHVIRLLDKNRAIVDISGVKKEIDVSLLSNVQVGDWILIHTGFAISKVDPVKAEEILSAFSNIEQY